MYNFIFDNEVGAESALALLHFLNDTVGEPKRIYLCTEGGSVPHSEVIIDMINTYKDEITLIGYLMVESAGMNILFETKCKKEVTNSCIGMIHQSTVTHPTNEHGKITDNFTKFFSKIHKTLHKKTTEDFMELLELTEQERKAVRRGKDLYLTPQRMKELVTLINKKNGY